MRFRVIFAEREPVEVEANEFEFTAAGGLVLVWKEFELVRDPQNLGLQHRVPRSVELRGAWSRDARWTEVQQIEEDEGGVSAPLEEVYAR
jgi:hypothetical protein